MNPKRLRAVTKPLAAASLILASLLTLIRRLHSRYYRVGVVGDSMSPALHPGDYLLLRRGPSSGREAPGTLVTIRDATGRPLLKRIIGLPGESLRVGTEIHINGTPLIEPYAHGETPQNQFRGVNRLGQHEYFLVGDNRAASTDSRDFGSIHQDRIQGVAVFRYWPPGRFGRLRAPQRQFGPPPIEPPPATVSPSLQTGD
ncbi:MAG: signal peptidase I [Dehalococcoidia bacterium]|jgi:signal peptidase I|nr:signal peptidase I [Dehalococcoidia bacterium]